MGSNHMSGIWGAMTNGQKIVAEALRYVGVVENPLGSNRGSTPINECQAMYGMGPGTQLGPQPWCACFCGFCFAKAGVSHDGVIHPHTGIMCQRADAKGGLGPPEGLVPPGALAIRCGTHVEIVVADRGNGLLDCVGGNVDQGVRRTVRRRADLRIIVPPDILEGQPEEVRVYWFEDPGLRPARRGGWATKDEREAKIRTLTDEERRRVRRINVGGPAPYAFEILRPGNPTWQFGSWRRKEARDRVMRRREARTGRGMRPRSRLITPPPAGVVATGGGVTTGDTVT